MITRFLPWKFLIKRAARRFGIIDPINLAARVRRFAQPSEVQEPIELLRAGIIFHARGLINTKAIQYNLDWVWPYWVERQFNPADNSFIPRAFSFSHVNLTHRNWTAVGNPDIPIYPIVDPRGLFTPLFDGWSLDCWIIKEDGTTFLPSRLDEAEQKLMTESGVRVKTFLKQGGFSIESEIFMDVVGRKPYAVLSVRADSDEPGWLVIALRPYNPEGIQFMENIEYQKKASPFWLVNRHTKIIMDHEPEKVHFSSYSEGDVLQKWDLPQTVRKVHDGVGMATSAAFFPIRNSPARVTVSVDLEMDLPPRRTRPYRRICNWDECLDGLAVMDIPDERIQFLYDAAIRSLALLSADDVVPGPYTYRRFWFRDACLMLNSMMAVNFMRRARRSIDKFFSRQKMNGYFLSQQGEWDSNGQVLWIIERFLVLSGEKAPEKWLAGIYKGAEWIERKRTSKQPGLGHGGLLPAGFSAEHLGPNDYYYWDDFWGLAGLNAASRIAGTHDSAQLADRFAGYAEDFSQCIYGTISETNEMKNRGCIPASPYRRMDAGAVGSLVADYPLQLLDPGDKRIMNTAYFLMENCFFKGAFFQDMIHSGINAYLTLDIAQSLLRNGDMRYRDLVETVAELASSTGQWPEAIHPLTLGGCMGDGQHGWAASEWVMLIRNLFVREEKDCLIIASGIFSEWLKNDRPIHFGPTPTPYGPVKVSLFRMEENIQVELETEWLSDPPGEISIRIPGYAWHTISDAHSGLIRVMI